jgi:hypothetical protein
VDKYSRGLISYFLVDKSGLKIYPPIHAFQMTDQIFKSMIQSEILLNKDGFYCDNISTMSEDDHHRDWNITIKEYCDIFRENNLKLKSLCASFSI